MASHSDELITRIYRAEINCEISSLGPTHSIEVSRSERRLRTLIKGIGDYLMRVVSSVPIDLKITLRVYDRRSEYRTPKSLGPFYYEGQGTGNV